MAPGAGMLSLHARRVYCQQKCLYADIISQAVKHLVCVCDLCRSQLFFYSAGISIGLLASLLILIYVMSKAMPRVSKLCAFVALFCFVVDLVSCRAGCGS